MIRTVQLRGSWVDARYVKGSFVHIVAQFNRAGQCVIDDAQGILILHPDHLISALVVADSFGCLRKAVLQDRVKAASESSPPMIYGTMLHEIFQDALTANRWDNRWLKAAIQTIVERHIEDLYAVQLNVTQAVEHLQSKMPTLQAWAKLFVSPGPKASFP